MERRTLLRAAAVFGGSSAVGGSLWRAAASASAESSVEPIVGAYGALAPPDENGLRLPAGFTSRIVARSGETVPGTSYVWHDAPDGGACFAVSDASERGTSEERERSNGAVSDASERGTSEERERSDGTFGDGWIYVSNSEVDDARGGAGALRFDASGAITAAHRILDGTTKNCAGGATPWGTWLSCEETDRGYVFETYPRGGTAAVRRDAMGRFKHEAAAVDPVRRCIYLTEDEDDGCFYRFVPVLWPNLDLGRLDVLSIGGSSEQVAWLPVPDPSAASTATRSQVPTARRFDGGEGCVYGADTVWFTTKGDGRVWRLDATRDELGLAYDTSMFDGPAPLVGVDNLARSQTGDLFVAEDEGRMEVVSISPNGVVASFLRVIGHDESELTGPAFSPDGSRMYFSSQRGVTGEDSGGVTFEVTGSFRDLTPQAAG